MNGALIEALTDFPQEGASLKKEFIFTQRRYARIKSIGKISYNVIVLLFTPAA